MLFNVIGSNLTQTNRISFIKRKTKLQLSQRKSLIKVNDFAPY